MANKGVVKLVKRYHKKDPHKQRETKKYGFPVPSREYISEYLSESKKPVKFAQFCIAFDLTKEAETEGFHHRLKAMLRDGQLHQDRRGGFALAKQLKLLSGRVIGHRDGFGFVVTDNPGPDIFLPERDMRSLFNDDRVLVRVIKTKRGNRLEGQLIEVLQRNTTKLVGVFHQDGAINVVRPDSKHIPLDVIIPSEECQDAQDGQFVEVEIVTQPSRRHQPVGRISRVIGDDLTPGLEIELAVINNKIPFEWPAAVKHQAETISDDIDLSLDQNRKDLRDLHFVTIDGADAKDFDDAVYCEARASGGWTLYVAIADVAHYVERGSAIDEEASKRGNSVYFPGRVIPMLPEVLSNGLCSLKPNVDRLTMVCEMQVSAEGILEQSTIYSAAIHSKKRWTYSKVANCIEQRDTTPLPEYLVNLVDLFHALEKQRRTRGALAFETTETRIRFNVQGKIASIDPVVRNTAHKLIEECMLMANVAVSLYCEKSTINALYRVHETPDSMKITQLRDYLKLFSITLGGGDEPLTEDFSKLLSQVADRKDAALLQRVILRSQKQAVYHAENKGHFALGYEGYTHFTSPIRRYSDLIVHRALKHLTSNGKPDQFYYDKDATLSFAEHCSMTERRADLATREAEDRLKCDFMRDKVGGVFAGTIVEVTNFGVFVELDEYYVQGLLHISAFEGDYYYFDELHHSLIGKHSGKVYRLTDRLSVLLANVNIEDRKIDFELADFHDEK